MRYKITKMRNQSKFILTLLKVVFIFNLIGLAISLISMIWIFTSHYFDWEMPRKFYDSIDFTKIWREDKLAFTSICLGEIIGIIAKIMLIKVILKILKELDLKNPFKENLLKYLNDISKLAVVIGFIGIFLKFFIELKVNNALIISTQIGESYFLWLAAIIYIITQVFQKGYELQSENDLTI